MFCTECGSKINDGANFCSNCGARVQMPVGQVQAPAPQAQQAVVTNPHYGLPEGMTMTADGKIWWSFVDKKNNYLCCFDDTELIIMYEEERPKEKSAFASFALDMVNLASVEANPFMDEPFPEGEERPDKYVIINGKSYFKYTPINLRYINIIKEDRKNNMFKVHDTYWWKLYFTPEQYDFALNHFITHCPNIKKIK